MKFSIRKVIGLLSENSENKDKVSSGEVELIATTAT